MQALPFSACSDVVRNRPIVYISPDGTIFLVNVLPCLRIQFVTVVTSCCCSLAAGEFR